MSVWQLVAMLYPINLAYALMENQVMTRLTKSVDSADTSKYRHLSPLKHTEDRTSIYREVVDHSRSSINEKGLIIIHDPSLTGSVKHKHDICEELYSRSCIPFMLLFQKYAFYCLLPKIKDNSTHFGLTPINTIMVTLLYSIPR